MRCLAAVLLTFLLSSPLSSQQETDSIAMTRTLGEVLVVRGRDALRHVSDVKLTATPVNTSQELLRSVPGLFIAQHAGGGKAEQMFLRGFDLDHGTDIAITVDGMPVNMPSHAHGQGYADLHFLLPETISTVEFGKGPYDAAKGDMATAGYVEFKTKNRVDNEISVEVGQYGMKRARAMVSLLDTERQSGYVSASYHYSDGYFISPQNFNRINLMGKYSYVGSDASTSVTLSHFSSSWNASGQIPSRAVRSGMIGRLGAIDDTEGGATSRSDINFTHRRTLPNGATVRGNVYSSLYRFNLYSNFTFYLNDPINGDQINQRESRVLSGANTEYNDELTLGGLTLLLRGGTGFRYDHVDDLALYHTAGRQRLSTFALGNVDESSIYAYTECRLEVGRLTLSPALRFDCFNISYSDNVKPEYSCDGVSRTMLCPKLNILYRANAGLTFMLKLGKGFHSNDARTAASGLRGILPSAYSADVGLLWQPLDRLSVNASGWIIRMSQELVYVGDEAVVEPGGRSRRAGVDVGLRYNVGNILSVNADYTYSSARYIDEPHGMDYVPLAPRHTFTAGLNLNHKGFTAGLSVRCLSDRPANEDYSVRAEGYAVSDLNASYTFGKVTLGLIVENMFNTEFNEAQFSTETRLKDETEPVTELHFTPGTPFCARGFITLSF